MRAVRAEVLHAGDTRELCVCEPTAQELLLFCAGRACANILMPSNSWGALERARACPMHSMRHAPDAATERQQQQQQQQQQGPQQTCNVRSEHKGDGHRHGDGDEPASRTVRRARHKLRRIKEDVP